VTLREHHAYGQLAEMTVQLGWVVRFAVVAQTANPYCWLANTEALLARTGGLDHAGLGFWIWQSA